MPLTPQDVHSKEFSTQKGLRKGYDEDEVDQFLDEVEAEIGRLLTENTEFRSRIVQLQVQLAEAQASVGEAAAAKVQVVPSENVDQAALRTLQMAQRTAEQVVSEAHVESEKIIAAARERAGVLERDAQGRHDKMVGELDRRRADLEARVEDLRAFEREYFTRLQAYLESQLRDLSSRRDSGGVAGLSNGDPAKGAGQRGTLPGSARPNNGRRDTRVPASVGVGADEPSGPPREAEVIEVADPAERPGS